MKTLNTHQTRSVTGAGTQYLDDICGLASTLTVANIVGGFAQGMVMGFADAMFADKSAGKTSMHAIAGLAKIGVPGLLADHVFKVNPDMKDAVVAKFHQYFG